ncbi:MAG: Rieske 2Fe-2S domain-containing protein [Gammaproteobacteria bacterium]|nr:Rieske 2Fe-2S domain-containing protein [Gammaproteobacteria bacterium]MCY4199675.1 Rieske 2Fe-2S domain-containing protein [Gammaproteobacteria bacterium]MCY4277134.1 Rieske 2Fe-2S domain-containing protein [Gammaproteobacteria bacterium]MCY4322933.1 Rieske 2Fe-2S domain-containing protein [Gammaproteobacteria bacterium]
MAELAVEFCEFGDDDLLLRHLDGVDVILTRIDGAFHAVENRCSHARSFLHTGPRSGHVITCPLHGAKFDLRTGACLAPPAVKPIKSLATRIEDEQVIIIVTEADKPAKPRFGLFN